MRPGTGVTSLGFGRVGFEHGWLLRSKMKFKRGNPSENEQWMKQQHHRNQQTVDAFVTGIFWWGI